VDFYSRGNPDMKEASKKVEKARAEYAKKDKELTEMR